MIGIISTDGLMPAERGAGQIAVSILVDEEHRIILSTTVGTGGTSQRKESGKLLMDEEHRLIVSPIVAV